MKPAVRQTRGPGMNLGLKKPRKKPAEPKPFKLSREMKSATKAKPASYLPPEGKSGKARAPKAMKAVRGKTPFNL